MVHTYARNHSLIELEDDNAIVQARESCWTLRVDKSTSNKAIFHNGHIALEPQEAVFKVSRVDGIEKKVNFTLSKVQEFETVIFDAEVIFPNLKEFLGQKDGWGTLHFDSKSSFTRLLNFWENSECEKYKLLTLTLTIALIKLIWLSLESLHIWFCH